METGKYRIYFRLWPTGLFFARDKDSKRYLLMYKVFDDAWGLYRWKEL